MDAKEPQLDTTAQQQTAAMEHAPPKRQSVWTARDRIVRLLWGTIGAMLWSLFPCFRGSMLRLFGGSIGKGCTFARTVNIAIPWQIKMGDDCHIGEHVILYSLGQITLGDRVIIDTKAHLCAGSHDMRDTRFPLTKPPIAIGNDCFIGIDAYIGPNVFLGDDICVHPRASVYKNFEGPVELIGNPARPKA